MKDQDPNPDPLVRGMDSRIRIHTPECHGSATLLLSALDPPRVQDPHIKLKISVADPGSAAFLTLDPGWVKNQHSDPG